MRVGPDREVEELHEVAPAQRAGADVNCEYGWLSAVVLYRRWMDPALPARSCDSSDTRAITFMPAQVSA